MLAYAVPVQRIWAGTAARARTSGGGEKTRIFIKSESLPSREHRLFENQLGGLPLSDFTVTSHLQCNLTEL